MDKIIDAFFNLFRKPKVTTDEAVRHSVDKYSKTYKLLEKYGKIGPKTPLLADDENIKRYFQQI